MTIPIRAVALAFTAVASTVTLANGGVAHAACPPVVSPTICDLVSDPVPDRCYYYPDTGMIRCYWDD